MQVDVIIPTFKREKLLREALESVRGQTYLNWKCWICDDGEHEATYDTAKEFLGDHRFQYVPGEHFGAPAKPRNRGIAKGEGELIAFLDDDDWWLPEKLEKQVQFFKNHPQCGIVGSNAYRWDGGAKRLTDHSIYFSSQKIFPGPIPFKELLQSNYLIASSVLLKREILKLAGLFYESQEMKSGEDYELWLRVASFTEAWSLDEPLLLYRETAPSTFYKPLNRIDDYKLKTAVLTNVLNRILAQTQLPQSPMLRQNAALCLLARDYYAKGPRLLGKARYCLERLIKNLESKRFWA